MKSQTLLSDEKIPHEYFNLEIYNWAKTIPVNKWFSVLNVRMGREKFTNTIVYLIACGEPLIFNHSKTAFKKEEPFDWQSAKQRHNIK